MKKSTRILRSVAVLGIMAAFIFDTKTAHEGVTDGLTLCIQSVIPSLFSFIFLSMLLTSGLYGVQIPLLSPLRKLCAMPKGTESILLIAFLGGYPVGAQTIHSAWTEGTLDTQTAKRMLGFCNNAGPSFIFGLLSGLFTHKASAWCLWAIHIVSALTVGWLLPKSNAQAQKITCAHPLSVSEALGKSIHILSNICGWVIFIRILLTFAFKYILNYLSPLMQVLVSGCIELTNGCISLHTIKNESVRFVAASFLLSVGGLCVLLQTRSVTGKLGTGMYVYGKLIQALISVFLAALILPLLYPTDNLKPHIFISIFAFLFIGVLLTIKKVVAFRQNLLYNNDSIKRKDPSLCFFAEK